MSIFHTPYSVRTHIVHIVGGPYYKYKGMILSCCGRDVIYIHDPYLVTPHHHDGFRALIPIHHHVYWPNVANRISRCF